MNTERKQVGWGFWLRWVSAFWLWWVLASTVGLAVGGAVGGAVGFAVYEEPAGVAVVVGVAVVGAVFGASVGIAQWLVLRRQVSRAGWWVLASTVGLAVGGVVVEAVLVGGALLVGETLVFAVFGASVGIAQWLVLRRWQVSRAGWWVLASTVGFAVTGVVVEAVFVSLAGYGAITGGVLVWLLRQPRPEA